MVLSVFLPEIPISFFHAPYFNPGCGVSRSMPLSIFTPFVLSCGSLFSSVSGTISSLRLIRLPAIGGEITGCKTPVYFFSSTDVSFHSLFHCVCLQDVSQLVVERSSMMACLLPDFVSQQSGESEVCLAAFLDIFCNYTSKARIKGKQYSWVCSLTMS